MKSPYFHDMKVHFLRGAHSPALAHPSGFFVGVLLGLFCEGLARSQAQIQKALLHPGAIDKVADIRYEVFNAKTGKDLSSRFRKKETHFYRGNDELCWFATSTTPMGKKASMCNPSPLKIEYLVFHSQEWPWEVSIWPRKVGTVGTLKFRSSSGACWLDFASWMPALSQVIDKSYISSFAPWRCQTTRMAPKPSKNHLEYPGWISTNGASPVLRALSTLGTFFMKKARQCRAFLCPWGHV